MSVVLFHCDWSAHVHHMLHYLDVVANCVPSFFGVVVFVVHHISASVEQTTDLIGCL